VTAYPRVEPLGDSALLAVLGEGVDLELAGRVSRLALAIRQLAEPGVQGVVPAYTSLAVHFDPLITDTESLARRMAELAARELTSAAQDAAPSRRLHVLPVRYDGPDLATVADRLRLAPAELVRRHVERTYHVLFLGFVPGFGYLGPLNPALALPRRDEPRRRVAAGSVAIAGAQTAVYPVETPGGWHLIGQTETVLFDPARDPPNLLATGDLVRFEPVL
jgi:KipI family sensor histidine kinase inhibitor